jgi:hypothetical protein
VIGHTPNSARDRKTPFQLLSKTLEVGAQVGFHRLSVRNEVLGGRIGGRMLGSPLRGKCIFACAFVRDSGVGDCGQKAFGTDSGNPSQQGGFETEKAFGF